MNPDDLIMKYIDGELSFSEDEELRNMTSLHPKIKEDFDLDIYIHSAIYDDSRSISPSPELVSSTEDKVLMKILSSQKNIHSKKMTKRKIYAYVAGVAALILINFIYLGDNLSLNDSRLSHLKEQMNLFTPSIISEEQSNNQTQKAIAENINVTKTSPKNIQNLPIINLTIVETDNGTEPNQNLNISTHIDDNDNSSFLKEFATKQNQDILKIDISQDFVFYKEETMIEHSLTQPMLNLQTSLLNLFQPATDLYSQRSDIQFSSFFGTDIYRNGIPDKKIGISHISQSIAYSINNDQRIGIEMGYTEYSYEQTVNVLVPFGSINDEKFIITQFNNDNENDLILYPIKFHKNQQVFWGAAFYEESLISNEFLSLVGRFGGGTTSDGPLGYTRLFAKVNIMKNLSINLGSEGRLFLGRVPELNSEKGWKSSVSLIYGFQFKF